MGGQWAERERGGGGSLDRSQTLKRMYFPFEMLWGSADWRSIPSNVEPSTFDEHQKR